MNLRKTVLQTKKKKSRHGPNIIDKRMILPSPVTHQAKTIPTLISSQTTPQQAEKRGTTPQLSFLTPVTRWLLLVSTREEPRREVFGRPHSTAPRQHSAHAHTEHTELRDAALTGLYEHLRHHQFPWIPFNAQVVAQWSGVFSNINGSLSTVFLPNF